MNKDLWSRDPPPLFYFCREGNFKFIIGSPGNGDWHIPPELDIEKNSEKPTEQKLKARYNFDFPEEWDRYLYNLEGKFSWGCKEILVWKKTRAYLGLCGWTKSCKNIPHMQWQLDWNCVAKQQFYLRQKNLVLNAIAISQLKSADQYIPFL